MRRRWPSRLVRPSRLRQELGTRRHRLLAASLARLEERLAGRLDATQRALEQRLDALEQRQTEPAQRIPPQLWNDLGREPGPPLGTPLELLETADAGTPLAAAAATLAQAAGPQAALLTRLGPEAIVAHARADARPLPLPLDRENYYGDRHLLYWLSGLGDCLWLESVLDAHGVRRDGARVLDLGASSGRVLRHVAARGWATTLYGFDIQPQAVRWMQHHLPEVTPALTTTIPSLPLADASVDAVYCGSLFTHIDEFEGAMLLELRRVLRPGGIAVVTIHPDRVWEGMQHSEGAVLREWVLGRPHRMEPPGVEPVTADMLAAPMPADRVVFRALGVPQPNANVVHSHAWIHRHWAPVMEICEIVERAHGDHQDGVVLRRRSST